MNRKSGDRAALAQHGKENMSAAAVSISQSRRRPSPRDEEPSQDGSADGPQRSIPAAMVEQALAPADEAWCAAFVAVVMAS